MQTFSNLLLKEVMENKNNNLLDNYCQFMQYESLFLDDDKYKQNFYRRRLPIRGYIEKNLEVKYRLIDLLNPKAFYKKIVKHYNDMAFLYQHLKDEASKNLLIKLIAYRILGYKKIKLPRNTPKYWKDIETVKKLIIKGNLDVTHLDVDLPTFDLTSLGYDIRLTSTAEAIAYEYIQGTYEYRSNDFIIKANKDDVVLDCGACWGDTTLYFSHEVGPNGKVYAFEFVENNLKLLNENLQQNSHLPKNVELIPLAVWETSNQTLTFVDHGPGSQPKDAKDQPDWAVTQECQSISIDDLVEQRNISKVDFIKMDIEGSELNALRGAEKTIRKFKPKLAISVYHKQDDLVTIPKYIHSLNLDYEFYLEHHTIHVWDSILFAVPKK